MELDAAFDDEQTQAGAWPRSDIAAAMERFEQMLLIFDGNADSTVANDAYRVSPIPLDGEAHPRPGL